MDNGINHVPRCKTLERGLIVIWKILTADKTQLSCVRSRLFGWTWRKTGVQWLFYHQIWILSSEKLHINERLKTDPFDFDSWTWNVLSSAWWRWRGKRLDRENRDTKETRGFKYSLHFVRSKIFFFYHVNTYTVKVEPRKFTIFLFSDRGIIN